MKNLYFELTDEYIKKLKILLKMKKITSYDLAHASYRKSNSHCIIKTTDKKNLTITFLNGNTKKYSTSEKFFNEIKMINEEYKRLRRKYIKRYYRVMNKWKNT